MLHWIGGALAVLSVVFFCLQIFGLVGDGEAELEIGELIKLNAGLPLAGVAVGVLVLCAPALIRAWKRGEGSAATETLKVVAKGECAFREFNVLVDLNNWVAGDPDTPTATVCETMRRVHAVIKSADPDFKTIDFNFATEGHAIQAVKEKLPKGATWRRRDGGEASFYVPGLAHIEGQARFRSLEMKRGRLDRSYVLTVPVEGAGQEIIFQLMYIDGYQATKGDWAGNIFMADADNMVFRVVFPPDKRPTSYKLRKGDAKRPETFKKVMNPNVELLNDRRVLEWRYANPKKGEAFEVQWTW